MSIFKRGRVYWFSFEWGGRRIQESTKSRNKNEARDVEASYRKALVEGRAGIVRQKAVPTFAQYAPVFTDHVKSTIVKKNTAAYYTDSVKQLTKFAPLQKLRLDEITLEIAAKYVSFRSKVKKRHGTTFVTRNTINHELATLRRMLNIAEDNGVIVKSTLKKLRLPKPEPQTRTLSFSEEAAYLNAAVKYQPLYDIVCLLLDSAARPDEIFRAVWENVSFEPTATCPFGFIKNTHGKTRSAVRALNLTARTRAILQMRFEKQGRPASGWIFPAKTKSGRVVSVASQHRKAVKTSGVAFFRIYALRHTTLSRMVEAGVTPLALTRIAGHSNVSVTNAYYIHVTESFTAQAHQNLQIYCDAEREKLKNLRVQ